MKASRAIGPEMAYALLFAAQGLLIPFMPPWLIGRGVDPASLGAVLAVTYLGKTFANPYFAHVADRTGAPLLTIRNLAAAGATTYFALWLVGYSWTAVALIMAASLLVPPLYPLTDRYAVLVQEAGRGLYGRLRLWGSVGFAIAACAAGPLMDLTGDAWLPLGVAAFFAAVAVLSVALPDLRSRPRDALAPRLLEVLKHRRLLALLLGAALVQSSNAFYYGYGSIFWLAQGQPATFVSVAWFIGIASEIGVFFVADKLVRWYGPERMLIVSALATTLRWFVLMVSASPSLVLSSQLLQGFTIAGNSAAILAVISRDAPENAKTRFIALYQTLGMGPFIAANTAFLAFWYGREGLNGFMPMTLVAAAACAVCIAAARMPIKTA